MIDIENQVFNNISVDVKAEYPNANMSSEEQPTPSSFPCVTIVEADNYVVRETMDNSLDENHAYVMYETNVYANNAYNKKAECKRVFEIVDNRFRLMGFRRMSKLVTSTNNSSICRITARYVGIVGKDETIYGGY